MTVIALEGAALEGSGHAASTPPGATIVIVADEHDAAKALRLAMRGVPVVIRGTAPRRVLDALYDDLRRFTRVDLRTAVAPASPLTDEERRLLMLLGDGLSLREAAAELHVSTRTADRRLAAARRKLGATTTNEAIIRARE